MKRSDTCCLVRRESSSRPLRSHVSGWNSVFGLLIRCDLVIGIDESGTVLTTGLGTSGDALELLGPGTLRTGLVGGEIGWTLSFIPTKAW